MPSGNSSFSPGKIHFSTKKKPTKIIATFDGRHDVPFSSPYPISSVVLVDASRRRKRRRLMTRREMKKIVYISGSIFFKVKVKLTVLLWAATAEGGGILEHTVVWMHGADIAQVLDVCPRKKLKDSPRYSTYVYATLFFWHRRYCTQQHLFNKLDVWGQGFFLTLEAAASIWMLSGCSRRLLDSFPTTAHPTGLLSIQVYQIYEKNGDINVAF